jgi:hypothetical protein
MAATAGGKALLSLPESRPLKPMMTTLRHAPASGGPDATKLISGELEPKKWAEELLRARPSGIQAWDTAPVGEREALFDVLVQL